MDTRTAALSAALSLTVLAGCGAAAAHDRPPAAPADDPAYEQIVAAVEKANVPFCMPEDGAGGYIPIPAPPPGAATASSHMRYLDGRIYEFGPCQLPAGRRNELRMYRYAGSAARDAALGDIAGHATRPTATFAFGDDYALEIWSPEPSLD
ncbi:MAG: hypothetical protein LC792_24320, partial [Actinobacteria bacterium]|nr:hypothetical protein [Actinomycetota bacterium]